MAKNIKRFQPVIARFSPHTYEYTREAVIFIPDAPCLPGNIMCYTHIGQHSEAGMEYFYGTKPMKAAPAAMLADIESLLREYQIILRRGRWEMYLVQKDIKKYRDTRWRRVTS